jgi:hypothetical protein
MTFFHGKGGTVGRGGNPQTFHAINSHPMDTINGNFRKLQLRNSTNYCLNLATDHASLYISQVLLSKER